MDMVQHPTRNKLMSMAMDLLAISCFLISYVLDMFIDSIGTF